jgi:periplasmic protein TonB
MNALMNSPPPPAGPAPFRAPILMVLGDSPPGRPHTRGTTFALSLVTHSLLIGAIVVLPLLSGDSLPPTTASIHAFFAAPPAVTPPPPPPPPPAGVLSTAPHRVTPPPAPPSDSIFRAPIETPDTIRPEEPSVDLGVEGGMSGGVEGGVAGGVVGGVIGGVMGGSSTASLPVVRIGGQVKAPKLLHRVEPAYPTIALKARITGKVLLRAIVDVHGAVQEVRIESGPPVLREAAEEAVRQWRYQPLLLNGEPRAFDLEVTVSFGLSS